VKALLELTKPRITRLILIVAAAGYYLRAGFGDLGPLAHLLVGTWLVASGTNGLNQWWEREVDAKMRRTRHRPLPSGRVRPTYAFIFCSACGLVGVLYLSVYTNLVTAGLAFLTLLSYVTVYTPLKRRSRWSTVIGSVPGALPIVGGWTAAGGAVDARAWSLFAIMAVWQIPHFLALALMYQSDYRLAGLRVLGTDEPPRVFAAMAIGTTALLMIVSSLPYLTGISGAVYLTGAMIGSTVLLVAALQLGCAVSKVAAKRVFVGSVVWLPLVLLMAAVDRIS